MAALEQVLARPAIKAGAAEIIRSHFGITEGEPPTFAGVNLDCVQIFLRRGQPAPQGCSVYFVIGDADALHAWHRSNGVEVAQPPDDRPYGLRDYTVRDLDGYYLSFGHRLPDH